MQNRSYTEYLAESRQADLYAAVTITYTGALVAVLLRFWARKLNSNKIWLDDYLIVAAQVSGLRLSPIQFPNPERRFLRRLCW